MVYITHGEEETFALGRKIAEKLRGGEILLLDGELGAGKTAFTKGIAAGLGIAERIVSPTFTLMNEYEGRRKLYHYDAYRLQSGREAEEAGLTEYFGDPAGVCVIEWASKIADALAAYRTREIRISYVDETTRSIDIADE